MGAHVAFTDSSGPNSGKMISGTTNASGDATATYTSTTSGKDTWMATFVDGNEQTQTSNPATVMWSGTPPPPTTVATSLSGGGKSGTSISVPTSTAVTDSATLSGTNAGTATGTVTYDVYSNSTCTTAVSTGTAKTITTPGTLPVSSPVTLPTAGTYYWQASYSGDTGHASSKSTCGNSGEVETVTAVTPTNVATSLSGGGKSGTSISVPTSTAVTDSATLSGTNAGTATERSPTTCTPTRPAPPP